MNEVYISGKVDSVSMLQNAAKGKAHLMLHMRVSHQNQRKGIKHEIYAINAWNGLAAWAERVIKPGKIIMVCGYLSQRKLDDESHVEITAKHIWLDQPDSTDNQAGNLPET